MRAEPGPNWEVGRSNSPGATAVAVGLVIAGGLAIVDALLAPSATVIGTVVLAPFVVSVIGGWRETALVAAVAFVLVVISGVWNNNFGVAAFSLRAVVVFAGGGVAVLAAGARGRITHDRARFELLAEVADVADGHLTLEETAGRLTAMVVPVFADICILDGVHGDGLRRLAVRTCGPHAAEAEVRLLNRVPSAADHPGSGGVIASAEPLLATAVTDGLLQRVAHDEQDLDLLRWLRITSSVIVPLSARGRTLGALTLLATAHSHRRYTAEDLRFVEVLAGRVALALDNAGLFTELQTTEAQLTSALGTLAEAVTVQSAQGNLIYANQAAAEVLGFASPQELLATPATRIADQYDSFREDGSHLRTADMPGRRVLDGDDPQALVVRVVDRRTGEQRWRQTKSTAVRDTDGGVKMIVNVISDITAIKRAELLQRLLADANDALATAVDLHDTLHQIADICVPELADWCAVSMPTEHHELQVVAVAHVDPEKVALARRYGERYPVDLDAPGGPAQVFRDGRPLLVNAISDEMLIASAQDDEHLAVLRGLEMRAALAVPLTTHGGTVGVLTLVSSESGRSFNYEDVALASELARLAATAVENARLYTERSRIASLLQESLLPDELPELPGCRTACLYRPAGDQDLVGGDFYQAFKLADGAWMLVVGDVTGRGASAAALTGLMRHTLRAIATFTGSATTALHWLNRDLTGRRQMSLCTAVCVVLREPAEGEAQAEIICAGHPLPILVREGAAAHVGAFGPMLGAFTDARWETVTVPIRPGDILVLYSDGVLDATGAENRFGAERLTTALAPAVDAADAVSRVDRALAGFQVGFQADDTALLAIERLAVAEDVTQPGESTDAARA